MSKKKPSSVDGFFCIEEKIIFPSEPAQKFIFVMGERRKFKKCYAFLISQ